MSSIPWLEDLEYLSTFERVFLVLIVIIGSMATGFALDAIMKNLGLGPIPNAVLALIGVCAGIYVRVSLRLALIRLPGGRRWAGARERP